MSRNREGLALLGVWVLLFMLVVVGCERRSETALERPPLSEADAILGRMIETYRHARTYADQGIVRLRYRADGEWIEDQARLAVRLQRPDRLLVRAYQLTLASDGKDWKAQVTDPQTGDLDGQFLRRPAPEELTLDAIYQDPLTRDVIAGGMGGPPITLELLIGDEPLEHLFEATVHRELLSDHPLASRACHRVRVTLQEGSIVFWIDRQTYLLRRLEYPTDGLAQQLDPEGQLEDLTLVADFRECCVNVDLNAEDFVLRIPPEAKIVHRFVLPPRPLPTDLLGRLPDEFHFTDLNSNAWSQQQFLGKTVVLAWFNIHPASELCMRQLAQVHRGISADEPVLFLAVCTEPTTIGNRQLARLSEAWDLKMPVVRDLAACGRDVFQIPGAPTVVVLDPRGVVQAYEVGANPMLGETLPHVIQQVMTGSDLAETLVANFHEQQQEYHRALLEVLQPAAQRDASRTRPLH